MLNNKKICPNFDMSEQLNWDFMNCIAKVGRKSMEL